MGSDDDRRGHRRRRSRSRSRSRSRRRRSRSPRHRRSRSPPRHRRRHSRSRSRSRGRRRSPDPANSKIDLAASGNDAYMARVRMSQNNPAALALAQRSARQLERRIGSSAPGMGGGGGGGRRPGGRRSYADEKPPKLYSIHKGYVKTIMDFGAFVELKGFRRNGLIHISQLADYKVDSVTDRVSVGDEVWVKVINVTKEEPIKVGLSLKMVDQDTAEDLDPNHVQASTQGDRSKARPKDRAPMKLGAVLNTTCTRCGGKGHMKLECFGPIGGGQYDLVKPPSDNEDDDNPARNDSPRIRARPPSPTPVATVEESRRLLAKALARKERKKRKKEKKKQKKKDKKKKKKSKKKKKKKKHKHHSSSDDSSDESSD